MKCKNNRELNNPKMRRGEVIFVNDNEDGGSDEQLIKIALGEGRFNDFEYGLPFGYDVTIKKVLDKKITGSAPDKIVNGERIRYYSVNKQVMLDGRNIYEVTLNGNTYRLKCNSIANVRLYDENGNHSDHRGNVLGNTSIVGVGKDTGEPFLYVADLSQYSDTIFTKESFSIYNKQITIVEENKTITPIPAEFLPNGIGGNGNVNDEVVFTSTDFSTFTCNKTYEECLAKLNEGNIRGYGCMNGVMCAPFTSVFNAQLAEMEGILFIAMTLEGKMALLYSPDGNIMQIPMED